MSAGILTRLTSFNVLPGAELALAWPLSIIYFVSALYLTVWLITSLAPFLLGVLGLALGVLKQRRSAKRGGWL
jgi:hypothetical protein